MLRIKYNGAEHPLVDSYITSAGEVVLKVPKLKGITFIEVRADLHSSEDIMQLLIVSAALTKAYFTVEKILEIPYFPYSKGNKGLLFKDMLTKLTNFKEIHTWDVRNEELITYSKFKNRDLVRIILRTKLSDYFIDINPTLVIPNEQASKAVIKLAEYFNLKTVQAHNVAGGIIVDSGFEDKDCVIIDNICDDGKSIIQLVKKLKEAKSIELYVTHGIFAKTIRPLLACGIEHIYTTNSFEQAKSPFITVLEG